MSFQRWHNSNVVGRNPKALLLEEDGIVGPETRRQLVLDYMSHDGTTLPSSIRPVVHGCGEYFPLDDTGDALDVAALDNKRDRADRRVELFFFDGVAGVQPPPPGPISKRGTPEYPTWRSRSALDVTIPLEPLEGLIGVRLPTRFAKSSDFPKPTIIQTLGLIVQQLRENPWQRVLLVGHADPSGSRDANIALARSRANSVRAWLQMDHDYFRRKFDAKEWQWAEVQWMLQALSDEGRPFYVGQVDGYPGPNTYRAVESYQVMKELPITGLVDDATLDQLIQSYLALVGTPVFGTQIEVASAGADCPPRNFGPHDPNVAVYPDDAPQRLRRVECFIHEGELSPAPTAVVSNAQYGNWCEQCKTEVVGKVPSVIALRVTDQFGYIVPNAALSITEQAGGLPGATTASAATDAGGLALVDLTEGHYSVKVRVGANDTATGIKVDYDELGGQVLAMVVVS